ncbi:hypothetical protein [Kitasatospora sp. NPDC056800]|uniref:hypothetical protein n=1 Tax=Kitasatospora sp. NPDC056800 TaxID=3345948 RepID=UPI00368DAECB
MEPVAGTPSRWHLALHGGALVELWADGYGVEGGAYVFSSLVRATAEEQEQVEVVARTPADDRRVLVAVARVPEAVVQDVHSAAEPARDGACACRPFSWEE